MNAKTVKPITATDGRPFRYHVNLDTGFAHVRGTCSNLGRNATAGSNVVRDDASECAWTACGKCVPAKCLA